MPDQALTERPGCEQCAYSRYKSCRQRCVTGNDDGKERCKKACDKIHDLCHERCNQRDPTFRCHDKCNKEYNTWSVAVDVLGFKNDESVRLKQVDWPSAIQNAAQFITGRVTDKVAHAGGGTLDPPIYPPDESTSPDSTPPDPEKSGG